MRLKTCVAGVCLLATILFLSNMAVAQRMQSSALRQMQSLVEEKESRTPAQKKMDSQLWYAVKQDRNEDITTEVRRLDVDVRKDAAGRAVVDIRASVTDALVKAIRTAGGEIITHAPQFGRVVAAIPLQALETICERTEVKFMAQALEASIADRNNEKREPANEFRTPDRRKSDMPFVTDFMKKKARPTFEERAARVREVITAQLKKRGFTPELPIGSVTSQGDTKHRAAAARTTFNVNGSGVRIGILSNSFNQLGAAGTDITNGDLPGPGNPNGFTTPVTVLSDITNATGPIDEGRAMLQIVHDLAPGAELYFATAFISEPSFAQGILDLRSAGCDIICDDVFYFAEPVFQDGIVAQAVNTVTASGALYFSSAGNQGNKNDNQSTVWEGDFVDGGPLALLPGGTLHDFGGGTLSNQKLTVNTNQRLGLYWSDRQGNSANDYDLFVLSSDLSTIVASSTTVQNGTQDPIEFLSTNATTSWPSGARIVVFRKTGAAARALHLNNYGFRIAINTGGQTHGHGSAQAAYSVAAVDARASAANPFTTANVVETFSSDGLRRIFYTPAGAEITTGNVLFGTNGGVLLQKPDIAAADGVFTSVAGFSSFFGTSAAAPHAAAIAALIKQRSPQLTPAQIRTALTSTAIDIETAGVDRDAGHGIVMAFEAVQSVPATPGLQVGTATLGTEGCTPGNSVIDPNETVTVSFCIRNVGGANTANLVGTLLPTGGVTSPGAAQNYGVVTAGGAAVCRNFTFTASGTCGGTITASIQFQDGATNLGTFTYTFTLGVPTVTFTQNFDAVTAPALPAGWTSDATGSGAAWTTSTTNPSSAPNAAFGGETATTGVANLVSATIPITTNAAQLSFRNLFNLEAGFDGELLEIKIGAGAFQDIITAGGTFLSGGYNGTLDASTAFPGKATWTGLSGGTTTTPAYITSVVKLPASAAGQNIQLRWRVTSDEGTVATGAAGVRIDNVIITDGATCCVPVAPAPSVTINQAAAQADPTSASPINFTVVFSENVTGFATGDVTLSGTAGATTATVTGSGTTYNVAVSGMTGSGTVIATVPASVAVNGGGIGNTASTSTDNQVTFNLPVPPSVTINQAAAQADPTPVSPINFTVVFSQSVTGFATGDVTLSGTAGATTATVTGSGTTYNVAVSGMTSGGTVIANIPAGVAVNTGGLPNTAATFTDNQVTYLAVPPSVTINQAASQVDPTAASPINFTAVFSEPVTGFTGTDVVITGTAGATTAVVTGTGSTYNVAVSGMVNPGTVIVNIPAAAANDIDGNPNTASTSTDNQVTFITCSITCPANITVTTAANQCGAVVNYPAPTITGSCGTVTSTPASGSFFPKGTTTVNVTSTSGVTCSFTVTVNDAQAPAITCPANIVRNNDANQCGAVVTFTPTATDNCPGTTVVSTPASGSFFPIGTTTVTSTATDAAGLTATCTFTVRVNDIQAPVFTSCPANITVPSATGVCTAVVNYTTTATDNCPGVVVARTAGPASGSAFPIGTTTVTHTATDAAGNVTTCTFTVTVTDGNVPAITAQPANRTVCAGSNATFSVTATNAVSYQWQVFSGGTWNNVAGATGATLTLNSVTTAMNTNTYRVNVVGPCSTTTSNAATLFVNPLPLVSVSATNSPLLLPTQTTSLVASVNPTGGTFVWQRNGIAIAGATAGTLVNLTVDNTGTYRVIYTDPNGCVNTSNEIVVAAQVSSNFYVAPNPNQGVFWVRYYTQTNEKVTLTVYDARGAVVYQKATNTTVPYTRIDVSLGTITAGGSYLVELLDGNGKRLGAKHIWVGAR